MGFRTKTIWMSDSPFDVDGYDSVCFYSCPSRADLPGFTREDRATIVVDLTKGAEKVWGEIAPKCRTAIRRSEKEGIEVTMDRDHQEFLRLNEEFRSEKGLDHNTFPLDFMEAHGKLFLARENGALLSGILFLEDDRRILGVLAASRRLEVDRAKGTAIANANRLLWWSAMEHAMEGGLETMDMGGYYVGKEPNPQMEGINEFKRRFGGKVVDSYVYRKDYTRRIRIAREVKQRLDRVPLIAGLLH